MAVSSRGNAESFVLAVVLLAHALTLRISVLSRQGQIPSCLLAGVVFGSAVHIKVYPVIYAAAYWLSLSDYRKVDGSNSGKNAISRFLTALFLPNLRQITFAFGAALGLAALTAFFYSL